MPIFAKDCFSYPALLSQLQLWDIPQQVALRFAECSFKVALPQLSAQWVSLTRHSLVYYLLKRLEWAFLEVRPHWIIQHSHAMKHHYSQLVLKHESDFDVKLILAVKTIAYFIALHLHNLLADLTLENDIYQLIVLNLLGLPLEPSAYPTLLKVYIAHSQPPKTYNPPTPKNIRHSHDVQILTNMENSPAGRLKPLQLVSRRHGKKQTAEHLSVGDCNLEQIKSELKENLYVKPPSRPRTPKFTIHQLRQLELNTQQSSSPQQYSIPQQTPDSGAQKNKKVFLSNQLSNAFEFNTDLRLKDVKKFPLQRSVAKLQPLAQSFYQIIKSTDKRLEIKRDESRTKCQVSKAGVKSVKNWGQIITTIKNELYTGKHKNLNRNQKTTHNYDQETDKPTPQPVQITPPHQTKPNNTETVKFRKLNLMNSPNVVIVAEGVENDKQVQVLPLVTKTHSLFQLKGQYWPRGSHLPANRHSKGRLLYRNSSIAELQKY